MADYFGSDGPLSGNTTLVPSEDSSGDDTHVESDPILRRRILYEAKIMESGKVTVSAYVDCVFNLNHR